MSLKSTLEQTDTPSGRSFALVVQSLIVVSLGSFAVSTLPDLQPASREFLRAIEVTCVGFFTVEYILRVAVATPRTGFVFSFLGLIDLAAILPFYIASGLDLRSIRAFRLLRLLRIFKLVRYSAAIRRFRRAFLIAREELSLFAFVALVLLFLSATGIHYFEREAQPETFASVFHAMWWAVVTMTTVGYGDAVPVTAGGQFFTFFVLMIGLGVVAVPTGLVATALAKAREEEAEST